MRSIATILILIALASSACARTTAPVTSGDRAIGFGASATGGAEPCHFADEASLRACLGRGGAYVFPDRAVTIDPGERRFKVAPNTTLDGKGILTIAPSFFGLDITVANVIVRNTFFHGPGVGRDLDPVALHMVVPTTHSNCATPTGTNEIFGCAVPIQLHGAARDVWIDHSTFANCGDICISVIGQNDGKGRPDLITVSNNIFRDSFFAANFGVSAQLTPTPTPGHATLYGNLFDHVFRRQPGSGDYDLHVFNNYWRDYGGPTYPGAPVAGCNKGFGPEVTAQAQMLLEANVAEAGPCREAVDNQYFRPLYGATLGYGKVRAVGNLGLRGATLTGNDHLDFSPPYAYRPLPANQVKAAVLANAGAPGNR